MDKVVGGKQPKVTDSAARTDKPMPSYEDRMESIIHTLGRGGPTLFRLQVIDFIKEQAQMIVRLENELTEELKT